jgi:hypothetical protein
LKSSSLAARDLSPGRGEMAQNEENVHFFWNNDGIVWDFYYFCSENKTKLNH